MGWGLGWGETDQGSRLGYSAGLENLVGFLLAACGCAHGKYRLQNTLLKTSQRRCCITEQSRRLAMLTSRRVNASDPPLRARARVNSMPMLTSSCRRQSGHGNATSIGALLLRDSLNALRQTFAQLLPGAQEPCLNGRFGQIQNLGGFLGLPFLQSQQPHDNSRRTAEPVDGFAKHALGLTLGIQNLRMRGFTGAEHFDSAGVPARGADVVRQVAIFRTPLPYFHAGFIDGNSNQPARKARVPVE